MDRKGQDVLLMILVSVAEELSDMRKQMKALEEKNVTYMKETMNLQEVSCCLMGNCLVVDLSNVSERSHIPMYLSMESK